MTGISMFAVSEATLLPGNSPELLHKSDKVATVRSGTVDLFTVPLIGGRPTGRRTFVGRLQAGEILFFIEPDQANPNLGLLAVGTNNTELAELPRSRLLREATPEFLQQVLEKWFITLFSELSHSIPCPPSIPVSEGESLEIESGATVLHPESQLCWLPPGSYQLLSEYLDYPLDLDIPFPLVKGLWVAVPEQRRLKVMRNSDVLSSVEPGVLIDKLIREFTEIFALRSQLQGQRNNHDQRQRAINDENQKHLSLKLLSRVYVDQVDMTDVPSEDINTEVMRFVCRELGLRVKEVNNPREDAEDHIQQLARSANIPLRRVLLRGHWWKNESEPMIGFLEKGNQALALLPGKGRGFVCYDPATNLHTPVDGKLVDDLKGNAFMPYRKLPSGQVTGKDLLKFSFFGGTSDLWHIFLFGSLGGVLALAIPLATGFIFDQVIPASDRNQLAQLTLAIVVVACAAGIFQYIQGLSILRLESRAGHALQSAVWDRLAKLPVSFFSNYSTGDLVQRAFGVDQIREQVSSTVIRTLLAFVFSVFSLALMFYYSVILAIWACLLIAMAVAFTVTTGLLSIPVTRRLQHLEGRLTGFVLQCIEGISKIRITNSQERAFFRWSGPFAEKRNIYKTTQKLESLDAVFNSAFPLFCSILIFYLMTQSQSVTLTTGSFLAFNAAFFGVLSSFLLISKSVVMIFRMVPVYERLQPILRQAIESDTATEDPGKLKGEIEISNIHFRYSDGGPSVLNGVNLQVQPGEFLALVGTSGGGKSTLFRILLGFETAQDGSIAFDGKDLAILNKQELRRQMGVVLQSGSLMPGDIYTNIIGSSNLDLEQAWEAARMAGFDEDIEQMPMGMHTILSEGGGGLSGGQKQRLQIARAFVHRPKILFFDEATSALDNRTQEVVTKSMNELNATRIVIAHRLSTVIDADRIAVLNKGVIEESGTYTELMAKEGLFYSMASRQIA